ncbi:4-alpha-glucanotransferase [Afipia sp. TerB]
MDLFEQARSRGVETSFVDGFGLTHTVDEGTLRRVLEALPPAPPAESSTASFVPSGERAYAGDFDRVWLLAVQLYAVRSRKNWGIGDFSDLSELIRWAAQAGAAGVGLNPLHALCDDHPEDCSPYSPNSRLFLNPLYIDVTKVPGFGEEDGVASERALIAVQDAELVDYSGVAELKMIALRKAHGVFHSNQESAHHTRFHAFLEAQPLVTRFACFEYLRRKFGKPWWTWPDGFDCPDNMALNKLRHGDDAKEIEFYEFVQWCADEQLRACSALATQLGLPIGLYLDVAVGVKADGFDAWNEQQAISRTLSVGAPPDLLNASGQNWGLAGFNATGLALTSFAPFGDMLRASMQYAGAIRLDHVLGLNRLYLVPDGNPADCGVYVRMPFEELLAATATESVGNRCVVIGEDLGTVPPGFREKLAERGIWSYRVMMFERDDTAFHPAERYPESSLVTFSTHDLPTFSGWSSAHDLALKLSLGLDPGETREAREQAITLLRHVVAAESDNDDTIYPVLGFLSRARSRILAISIEDLLGVVDQPNVPGTIDSHPNWRRRLPCGIEELDQNIDISRLRKVLKARALRHPPDS